LNGDIFSYVCFSKKLIWLCMSSCVRKEAESSKVIIMKNNGEVYIRYSGNLFIFGEVGWFLGKDRHSLAD
jgi:hypothetical protein